MAKANIISHRITADIKTAGEIIYHHRRKKMKQEVNEISINGVDYVKKDSTLSAPAVNTEGKPYVIIRTYSAGVFAGYLYNRKDKEVELINARRLWYWAGAASLSQLAVDGVGKPSECKFPTEVPSITLTECIEVIPCSEKARKSIAGVSIWKA